MRADKSIFNSLPVEIIKEIFCYVGSPDLFVMKLVCSFWGTIIQDLLNIKEVQVSVERYSDAINVVRIDGDVAPEFKMFQAPCRIQNLISEKIIGDQIGGTILILKEISHLAVFKRLRRAPRELDSPQFRDMTFEDLTESSWNTIIAMTGIDCSVGCLENKSFENGKEVEYLTAKYRWYTFAADFDYSTSDGLVVLYPDSRTFAILYGLDTGFAHDSEYDYEEDYNYDNDYFYFDEPNWDL